MKLREKGYPPLLLEDPLISETCPLEESASHHVLGALILRMRGSAKHSPHMRTRLGALLLQRRGGAKHSPHMRTPEIHQKSSEIDDLENEPGHVWRLTEVSGFTRDDTWGHSSCG